MEDDFEYYITFPKNSKWNVEPIIILFGWAGCIDRYLAKYSDVYQQRGCTTIRCITSPNVVSPRVIDEKKIFNLAGDVINLLLEMRFDKHPIFFHIFSNGGATVYRYVSEMIQEKHSEEFKVRGCIFDSCPARVRPAGFLRATLAMTGGGPFRRWCVALAVLLRALVVGAWSALLGLLTGRPDPYGVWGALLRHPNACPQLFLFSRADDVCPWDSIRDFAEARRKRGVDVRTVLFPDSPHVKHLLVHREEYVGHVTRFVEDNAPPPPSSADPQGDS